VGPNVLVARNCWIVNEVKDRGGAIERAKENRKSKGATNSPYP
jgi:hypothetical protein